jgi:hypothetical protein
MLQRQGVDLSRATAMRGLGKYQFAHFDQSLLAMASSSMKATRCRRLTKRTISREVEPWNELAHVTTGEIHGPRVAACARTRVRCRRPALHAVPALACNGMKKPLEQLSRSLVQMATVVVTVDAARIRPRLLPFRPVAYGIRRALPA